MPTKLDVPFTKFEDHREDPAVAEIREAISGLSPEARNKLLGVLAISKRVLHRIEMDAWTVDRNREILATRRFLAQANRRGYIHRDDRYDPLREEASDAHARAFGLGDSDEKPTSNELMIRSTTLLEELV